MKFTTEIWAVDPRQVSKISFNLSVDYDHAAEMHGKPVKFAGPIIEARSREEAEDILLQVNGLGYARITGEYVESVDSKTGKKAPLVESPWIYHD